MPRRADRSVLYEVTRLWLEVVARQGSLFEPAGRVWDATVVEALIGRVVGSPETDASGFQDKLGRQARAEGPVGQRLAAEAMYVFLLKDASGLESTKRQQYLNDFHLLLI